MFAVTYLDENEVVQIWTGGLDRSAAYAEDVEAREFGLRDVVVRPQDEADAVAGKPWNSPAYMRAILSISGDPHAWIVG